MTWISVKDRLPENSNVVLISGAHDWPWIGKYYALTSTWIDASDGEWIVGVTHWRELPHPPEDE